MEQHIYIIFRNCCIWSVLFATTTLLILGKVIKKKNQQVILSTMPVTKKATFTLRSAASKVHLRIRCRTHDRGKGFPRVRRTQFYGVLLLGHQGYGGEREYAACFRRWVIGMCRMLSTLLSCYTFETTLFLCTLLHGGEDGTSDECNMGWCIYYDWCETSVFYLPAV